MNESNENLWKTFIPTQEDIEQAQRDFEETTASTPYLTGKAMVRKKKEMLGATILIGFEEAGGKKKKVFAWRTICGRKKCQESLVQCTSKSLSEAFGGFVAYVPIWHEREPDYFCPRCKTAYWEVPEEEPR